MQAVHDFNDNIIGIRSASVEHNSNDCKSVTPTLIPVLLSCGHDLCDTGDTPLRSRSDIT